MSVDNKVPEIRFEGFGGEWGQDNISNIAPLQRGFDLPKNSIKVGAHPVVMSNGVNCFHNEFRAKAPGVVTGRSGTIGNIHYIDVDYWPHNTSLWVTNFHKNVPLFIYYLYVKLDLKRFGTGSGVPTLNRNDVHVQSVALPKDSKEQAAIGNYFRNLDTLINQHQQKHDKLSNIKKAMLEKMFPKQGKTIPEIRFKGFSGEWETMTLSDYTTFRRGSFPQPYGNKEWYGGEGAMPFVQVVDVSKDLSLVEDTKQKISIKAQPRSVFVPKGSVVVTLQGTIGRVAVTQFDSFVDRTILIFEGFSRKTDSSFWAYTIQNKFDLEKKRAPGGTIKTITKDALSSFDVLIPSTEEQTAIGNYFQKLDVLINQHQQQITKLNNIKQACLSKMFV